MNADYERDGFVIMRGFIPHFMADFFRGHMETLRRSGRMTDGDPQVGLSNCVYGDPALDTFMFMSTPMVSKVTGVDLLPTYTYARIYHAGAELLPHVDRPECEHSMTISFGGEYPSLWPIWMMDKERHESPQMVALYPGDAVIYQGTKVNHWRDGFEGDSQYQAFLHFVDSSGPHADKLYDGRPYIGMSADTKR
jgi:hypothetical protein